MNDPPVTMEVPYIGMGLSVAIIESVDIGSNVIRSPMIKALKKGRNIKPSIEQSGRDRHSLA